MMKRVGNQAMRRDDAGRLAIRSGMDRIGVFDWVQLALSFHSPAQFLIRLRKVDCFYPRHTSDFLTFKQLWFNLQIVFVGGSKLKLEL
jgi:hypothetical protein